jgi:hypothetical protein
MDDYSGMLFDNRHSQFFKDSSAVSLYGGLKWWICSYPHNRQHWRTMATTVKAT